MRIWITGAQGTGKVTTAKLLEEDSPCFKVGKLFTNLNDDELYHKELYILYEGKDVRDIFENNAYIFMKNISKNNDMVFDGLDFSEYDDNNVCVISIDQFINLNMKYISKDDIIIWLDGRKNWRLNNIKNSKHNIYNRERLENSQYEIFGNLIDSINQNNKNVIYFNEEDPTRVKTIIKTIYNNPKLKSEFVKYFNY